MKALDLVPHTFLLMAMILVAPHIDWPTARVASLVCLGLTIIFMVLAISFGEKT